MCTNRNLSVLSPPPHLKHNLKVHLTAGKKFFFLPKHFFRLVNSIRYVPTVPLNIMSIVHQVIVNVTIFVFTHSGRRILFRLVKSHQYFRAVFGQLSKMRWHLRTLSSKIGRLSPRIVFERLFVGNYIKNISSGCAVHSNKRYRRFWYSGYWNVSYLWCCIRNVPKISNFPNNTRVNNP